MQKIIISGKIGSGKSSCLKNQNFLKKFPYPQKIISTDTLAKELYATEISEYLFQKNPYLRKVLERSRGGSLTGRIHKNLLRKYLFFSPKKTRNFYWKSIENILHPQVSQKIQEISTNFQKKHRKKGTLFIECAVPEKIINFSSGGSLRSYYLPQQRFLY